MRFFAFGQVGALLGDAAASPVAKRRETYLAGAGVSVEVF